MKDYYKLLGISKSADADEIKKAYRKLASVHHPDKGGDTAKFQDIQEAYAILSDPDKRSAYDNPRSQFGPGPGGPGFNFDAIFDMFGTDFRQARQHNPRVAIWISLTDVMTGGPRPVSLQTGNTTTNVEINIPPGITDGDSVRYPGLMPGGHDLIVTYRIKPDPVWRQDGTNLIIDQIIDIWDLILGCSITIKNILGTELAITIPPETQPNSLLRVRGQGLPARKLTGDWVNAPSGDLLLRLQARIITPPSEELKDSIRKFKGL